MRNNRGGRPRGRPQKEWSEYVPKGIDPAQGEESSDPNPSGPRHRPTEDKSAHGRINKNPRPHPARGGRGQGPFPRAPRDRSSSGEYFERTDKQEGTLNEKTHQTHVKNEKNEYRERNDYRDDRRKNERGGRDGRNQRDDKDNTGPGLVSYQKKEKRKLDKDAEPVHIDGPQGEDRTKKVYQWRECVVCLLKCSPTSTVWNCSECRITCHLKCIKDWICKQNNLERLDAKHSDRSKIFAWTCPHCQNPFKQPLPQYICFCGQTKNPRPDVYLEPHSCGLKCGRKRGGLCSHPCPQPCHSGACPPCDVLLPAVSCFCGRETADRLCGELNKRTCGQPCRKTLNCGLHHCDKPCHEGDCPPCALTAPVECHCGKLTETRRCGETLSCGQPCGRQLDCEVHRCSLVCHPGSCPSCSLYPPEGEKCFCGKRLEADLLGHPRDGCHEEKVPCGQVCAKTLPCGHPCVLPCHSGPCKCGKTIEKKCRCGQGTFPVECQNFRDEVLCERVCKKKKSCGVHRCENKCCIAFQYSLDHQCMDFCGKLLACGVHPCPRKCHTGKCGDCTIRVNQTLRCACGDKVIPAPVVCGTAPPLCDKKCGKPLPCGHNCLYPCHFGDCKPCQEIVDKPCECGKKIIPHAVCSMKVYCPALCKTVLPCGHECGLSCHSEDCLLLLEKKKQELKSQGQPFEGRGCTHNCGKKREGCGHPCDALCHPDSLCPLSPCKMLVKATCKCGNRTKFLECGSTGKKVVKELPCEDRCLNLQRFKALYEKTAKKIYYPGFLVKFAKNYLQYLLRTEARLSEFLLGNEDRFDIVVEKSNWEKLKALTTLLPRHYLLDVVIHKCFKNSTLTVTKTPESLIPPMLLSVYLEKVSRGDPDLDQAPFEARIRFLELSYNETPAELERLLQAHKQEIYIELDRNNNLKIYLWDKDSIPAITKKLEKSSTSFSHYDVEIYKEKEEEDALSIDPETQMKIEVRETETMGDKPQPVDEVQPEQNPQVSPEIPQLQPVLETHPQGETSEVLPEKIPGINRESS